MKRIYKKLLLLFLLASILNFIIINKLKFKALKAQYIVTNFLEYYVKSVDNNVLDVVLTVGIGSNCRIPKLNFNNWQAINYLKIDEKRLENFFASCLPRSENATSLNSLVKISVSDEELYTVQLKMNKIMKNFQLDKQPHCSLLNFDKKMNVSEIENKLEYLTDQTFYFTSNSNFTTNLTRFGYFYLRCEASNSFGIKSLIFDNVLTVLPYNMSKLMERRFKFKRLEKERFDTLTEPNNHLVVDAEFERCSKKSEIKEKMNVLILGLDSVSSAQFRRVFPRTYEYLNKAGSIFESLNSVGSNTYPNMLGRYFLFDKINSLLN